MVQGQHDGPKASSASSSSEAPVPPPPVPPPPVLAIMDVPGWEVRAKAYTAAMTRRATGQACSTPKSAPPKPPPMAASPTVPPKARSKAPQPHVFIISHL